LYTYVQVCFAGVSLLGAVLGFDSLDFLCSDRALLAFLEDVFRQVVASVKSVTIIYEARVKSYLFTTMTRIELTSSLYCVA
jgi:hypothetical protein